MITEDSEALIEKIWPELRDRLIEHGFGKAEVRSAKAMAAHVVIVTRHHIRADLERQVAELTRERDHWKQQYRYASNCVDATEERLGETRDALSNAERREAQMREALANATKAENSNARRMRDAIVEARRRLAKGRAVWNGPCHECDAVLEAALRASNDAAMIAALAPAPTPGAEIVARLRRMAQSVGPNTAYAYRMVADLIESGEVFAPAPSGPAQGEG